MALNHLYSFKLQVQANNPFKCHAAELEKGRCFVPGCDGGENGTDFDPDWLDNNQIVPPDDLYRCYRYSNRSGMTECLPSSSFEYEPCDQWVFDDQPMFVSTVVTQVIRKGRHFSRIWYVDIKRNVFEYSLN